MQKFMTMKNVIVNLTQLLFWHYCVMPANMAIVEITITIAQKPFQTTFMWRNIVVFVVEQQQRTSSIYILPIQFLSENMSAWMISPMKQLY